MYKGKNIYLNFIAFSVLLKKKILHKKSSDLVSFPPLCAGCETSVYVFVLINDDYLSAIGKWTTDERKRRGVGGWIKREEEAI